MAIHASYHHGNPWYHTDYHDATGSSVRINLVFVILCVASVRIDLVLEILHGYMEEATEAWPLKLAIVCICYNIVW